MKLSTFVVLALVVASSAVTASAQTTAPSIFDVSPAVVAAPATSPGSDLAGADAKPVQLQPATPSLFRSMTRDFTSFFSTDTAKIVGVFAIAGLAVSPMDKASVEDTSERLSPRGASIGNWGGSAYTQVGAGLAAFAIGKATGNARAASLGGDLIRAQVLTEIFVQGTKFAASRQRPDGSDALSFPSGHSASAFATATVLEQHFGWKVGIPAYTFAGFVGASRMASSKHYLSDVLVGAGIGIATGRTVTLHLGREKFALGAAPTQGCAMVTFTKR